MESIIDTLDLANMPQRQLFVGGGVSVVAITVAGVLILCRGKSGGGKGGDEDDAFVAPSKGKGGKPKKTGSKGKKAKAAKGGGDAAADGEKEKEAVGKSRPKKTSSKSKKKKKAAAKAAEPVEDEDEEEEDEEEEVAAKAAAAAAAAKKKADAAKAEAQKAAAKAEAEAAAAAKADEEAAAAKKNGKKKKKAKKADASAGDDAASAAPSAAEPSMAESTASAAPAEGSEATAGGKKKKGPRKRKGKGSGSGSEAEATQAEADTSAGAGEDEDDGEAGDESKKAQEEKDEWVVVPKKKPTKAAIARAEAEKEAAKESPEVGADAAGASAADAADAEPEVPTIDLGQFLPVVIGKKGVTIKGIQEATSARLKIKDDSTICSFHGDADAVANAMQTVQSIIDREQAQLDSIVEEIVEVGDKIPAVIGKKGANIRKIDELSGADLKVNKPENTVTITGDAAQVARAKELVELYMAGGPPPDCREEVELGSERGRYIVLGNKGTTIRAIQEETGAKLTMERGKTFVVVEGDEEQVAAAVAQLDDLLNENSFNATISANGHIAAIIGKGGVTIKGIREKTGAAVDLIGDMVKLTGTQEAVEAAKVVVEKIIADEQAGPWAKLKPGEVCEEMQLGDAVGMVIGRQGTMIRTIKEESGADLDISRENSGEVSLCRVFGKPECVEKAKAAIAEILERHKQMKERRAKYEKEQAAKKAAKEQAEGEGSEGDAEGEDNEATGGDDGEGEAAPAKAAESAKPVAEPATDGATKEAGGGWDADPSADMGVGTNGW